MRKYVIALYIRLSVEDIKTESLSIPNQRLILREKAMSLPEWDNGEVLEFVDNGHTGTNFERPAVQELLTMVQAGSIDCIIVKDLSRFGRNSIETGYFIERVFPLYHTRFISVSDDFDTVNFKGDTGGIDVAFKYLISECYSRDMSMKTKSAKYAKMRRGEYQSVICPYGYRKSADGRILRYIKLRQCVTMYLPAVRTAGLSGCNISCGSPRTVPTYWRRRCGQTRLQAPMLRGTVSPQGGAVFL